MKESKIKINQKSNEETPARGEQGGGPYSTEYDGLAYADICRALLREWGIEGDVVKGARNNVLYKLCRNLRYICDFDVQHCLAVTPRWGLTELEARAVAVSAVGSERGVDMPLELVRALNAVRRSLAYTDDIIPDEPLPDPNPLPGQLPPVFAQVARRYSDNCKAAVLAALPAMGTLLTHLRSTYADGEVQCPIFFVVVTAPQASGKSFARELSYRLTKPLREADEVARAAENDYKQQLKAKKNTQRQPDDPRAVVRVLPSTISNAMLLKRADYAQGKALYTFAEEIDTVARSNKAGAWSQKSDIYRMAFDGAEWGQDYMSENSYSGVVELHYNLLMLGTPMAVSRFFRYVEDGMASRFTLTALPDTRGQMLQTREQLSQAEEALIDETVREAYAAGNGEVITFHLPRVLARLEGWQQDRIREYNQNPDNVALDVLRRRAAVIGFRAGMLAWYLQGRQEDQVVEDFALWVANEVLAQQLKMFGDRINAAEKANMQEAERQERLGCNSRTLHIYDELPDKFTLGDLVAVRHRAGLDGPPYVVIHRWLKAEMIMKSSDKRGYLKLKVES